MPVLTLRPGEAIRIGEHTWVVIVRIKTHRWIQLGIEVPPAVTIEGKEPAAVSREVPEVRRRGRKSRR